MNPIHIFKNIEIYLPTELIHISSLIKISLKMDIEDIISDSNDLFKSINLDSLKSFIIRLIQENPKNFEEFDKACIKIRREVKLCPKKSQIIHYYRKLVEDNEIKENPSLEKLMIKKLVRGTSGVEVITVLTSPFPSWNENGVVKEQKFSCGKNCGYCPKEAQVDLNCYILKIVRDDKFSTITLKSDESIEEVRVITFLTLNNNEIIYCFKQKNFNESDRTFDVIILNKYMTNINVGENCVATKIEQPRSYISTEPAVMRANRNNFDPILQFYNRASGLEMCGHIIDKIELLVLGGTWSHYNKFYQEEFIRDLYYAANTYYSDSKREKLSIEHEIKCNETSKCRIIGLTLETRPDCINKREIKLFRKYGCTRVQLGVQHIDDKILTYIDRGCYTKHTINAISILKTNGFKVDIHLMPDLPGSSFDIDKKMFDHILGVNSLERNHNKFTYKLVCPEIQADQWKIYPTEVTRWTKIFDMFHNGTYVPYAEEINKETGNKKIVDLLINTKQQVFPWIRLNRVIRDIPDDEVYGGNSVISLRQNLHEQMKKEGKVCHCIRCREIRGRKINLDDIQLYIREYNDVNASEYFISFESKDQSIIYGFCRLRLNQNYDYVFFSDLQNAAIIRELHVYGLMVPHDVSKKTTQHMGFGKKLVKKAEEIAYNNGYRKMAIISGVGVREYYENRGYILEDTYMTKILQKNESFYYYYISLLLPVLLGFIIYFYI